MTARILVVEDDPKLSVPLQYLLELNGFDIMLAHDGHQAVEILPSFKPDIVLLDTQAADMAAYETCQCLKALPGGSCLKVVFITALADEISRAKAYSCGVDAWVPKPFSNQFLLETLNRLTAGCLENGDAEGPEAT